MATRVEKIVNPVVINEEWLKANRNEKADNSLFQHSVDYCGSSNGTFRTLQGAGRTIRLGNELGKQAGCAPSRAAAELSRDFGVATSAMGIARLPSVTRETLDTFAELRDETNLIPLPRKIGNAVKVTTDAVSAYGYAASFITKNPGVLAFSQAVELTSDVTDLNLSVSDYTQAAQLETIATGKQKEAVTHSKNYYLLRIIKAIMSIASGILGLSMMVLGAPLLPALALILISLATTIFAVLRDNYKNMGQYKVIELDRPVTLG